MSILNNIFFLVLGILMLTSTQAMASDKEALARAQYMLRQVSAERSQLKISHQKLLDEKKMLEKNLEKLQKNYDQLTSKSEKNKTALKGHIKETRARLKEERKQHNDTKLKLSEMTKEKDRLLGLAAEQTQAIDLCVANNRKLYEVNNELLSQYENKGVWDAFLQGDPLTGLTRVEVENLVDDYQYRLDDLRVVLKQ